MIRVSIPEGLSRSEVASTIRRSGITGSYLSASARSAGFDPRDYGQPRSRKGLEGFLFPATYDFEPGTPAATQFKAMVTKFKQVAAEINLERQAARAYLVQLGKARLWPQPIVTKVEPYKGFQQAEAYHQDFARLNPARYAGYSRFCGRAARLRAVWGE